MRLSYRFLVESLSFQLFYGSLVRVDRFFNSLPILPKTIIRRDTFKPPAVEPAQPPININTISTVFDIVGHCEVSAIVKPVVEIYDVVWKNAFLIAVYKLPTCEYIFDAMSAVETKIIMRNT